MTREANLINSLLDPNCFNHETDKIEVIDLYTEKIAEMTHSYTGKFLKSLINNKMKKTA